MEGYNVGIRLGIVGSIFGDLGKVRAQIGAVNKDALLLRKNLAVGMGRLGLGLAGLGAFKKLSGDGAEYLHLINMATVSGMKHASVVKLIGDAWKETGKNSFTSVNQNMRAMIDARKILGSTAAAFSVLPDVVKLQTAIAGSADKGISSRSEDITFGALKALDMLGKVRDPKQFRQGLSMMSQAIIWGQGRILPKDFQQAFKYERQSSLGLSPYFQYRILPSLMLEMKGGGGGGSSGGPGAMLAAFSRVAVQGIMSRATGYQLAALGISSGMLGTTTPGTIMGHMKGAKLAAQNPFEWVQTVLLPAITQKYGKLSSGDLIRKVQEIFKGNQLATQLITWFIDRDKSQNILRDAMQIGRSMNYREASTESLRNDPLVALRSMKAQWANISVALSNEILRDLLPTLRLLTSGMNDLARILGEYPGLTKLLVGGFVALSAAMAISGTIKLVTLGFSALSGTLTLISLTPVGRILTVVAGLIAFLSTLYGISKSAPRGTGPYDLRPDKIADNMRSLAYGYNGNAPFNANDFLRAHPERDSRVHDVNDFLRLHPKTDPKVLVTIYDKTSGGIHAQMHRRQIHETGSTLTHSGVIPATVGGGH